MKLKLRVLLFITAILLANCATGPTMGALFTSINFPGEINPENNVKSTKSAKGCQYSILGLIGFGDAGAGSIASKNEIIKVATIDHSSLSILGITFRNYCTIVSGESK
jgi:hypothetical protein